jgi:A/G-specific adenine glycosylase
VAPDVASLDGLLEWYAPRRAAYPWRRPHLDPYAVLVSEVMLQQTQAPRVVPAFEAFMARFPTVQVLAGAPVSAVLRQWSGLGYNRRAVALLRAARAIVRDHGARVPPDPSVLVSLPGVGPYTAAAVASLAYGRAVPAIDTNVRRILARVFHGLEPEDVPAGDLRLTAEAALDRTEPGAWNQALMDLGRELCRARPRCEACPVADGCRSAGGIPRPAARARPRQSPFEGSLRQVRGAVVREIAAAGDQSVRSLVRRTGHPAGRLALAVAALTAEGMVEADPAALDGRLEALVRLAEPGRREEDLEASSS